MSLEIIHSVDKYISVSTVSTQIKIEIKKEDG